ncbi:hypothetical protein [Roseicella frigidaeris]|uniref:Uncharacterized protein n=1 Tax=Roseicella frigidaeris TaxID=2230885 RepID=A0A327MIF1_9PROT|nr:hypothetical protein [Roseicella frigidaeris]RAI59958.1 hypothetical protein DOO78_06870 [Roseicella frigidaeris]
MHYALPLMLLLAGCGSIDAVSQGRSLSFIERERHGQMVSMIGIRRSQFLGAFTVEDEQIIAAEGGKIAARLCGGETELVSAVRVRPSSTVDLRYRCL